MLTKEGAKGASNQPLLSQNASVLPKAGTAGLYCALSAVFGAALNTLFLVC